jgi:hypothetical protein
MNKLSRTERAAIIRCLVEGNSIRSTARMTGAARFMHYNFARPHMSLGKNTTPAMAAGVADHVWTCDEIAELIG